jgi:Fe-Mn family superoxide dismutase
MPRHVIRPGDTIKAIAQKSKISINNLTIANTHIDNFENLRPGDVLFIPDYSDGTFTAIEAKTMKTQLSTMLGFSPRQIQEHYKLYLGYINKTNEIRAKLTSMVQAEANSIYSDYRSLKLSESFAVGGYKLHELYFENLGGQSAASGVILEAIVRDFGSYEFWEKDFRATALASRGWVILGYDYDDCHLHNYGQDLYDVGPVVRFEPLLVMDVYEHAYFLDYGTNRSSYIDAFMRNIDWLVVNSRLANIKSL